MKRCPDCGRNYNDDSMSFCLDDGAELLFGPAAVASEFSSDEPATAILSEPGAVATGFRDGDVTRPQVHTTDQTTIFPRGGEAEPQGELDNSPKRQGLSAHRAAKPLAAVIFATRETLMSRYMKRRA